MEMAVSLSVRLFATNSIPSAGGTGRCNYTEIAEWFESIGVGQRALPIRVFTVGKKRSPAVQLLVDEYTSKLRRYCAVEDVQVRSNPRNAREKQAQIVDEDVAVMNLIKPDDWVVLLDEQGIDIESEEMAELIGGAADKGASKLSFCIGGPYGHGPKLRERANISIKLSSLVLNHQIALVVLMEQLYRSWTILKGQKYHH
ncbi:putative RNA methyltransferase At5g10620 isoform X3 [Eucalyptus grandis]|uniref:putative RNA methyltransferase At5g10620 isoform X3 n=1 Tax=Eucalyptus grandis TaxID=71139 RepID=UPI000525289C|nr:putative RNA methyltransferase At5g10620 isoform X3 [Eucalyptus grandis]XP_010049801.1 putative RNA methyltransferase At5g10620 isoform X3 [Eucalyptus grandis]XP_010049802.1 putative RNA methyltransferase At5g10620 isoform X3 [Eucalyptus grandis]